MHIILRLEFVIWLLLTIVVLVIVTMTRFLPVGIGTLSLLAYHEGIARTYYIDFDKGFFFYQNTDEPVSVMTSIGVVWNTGQFSPLSDATLSDIISKHRGLVLHPDSLFWLAPEQTFLLVGSSVESRTSTIFLIDYPNANWRELASYPDMNAGSFSLSPDAHYLILRETQQISTTIPISKPMRLIDLQTGQLTDLGSPNFAYWSPDSSKLALGYPSKRPYVSQLYIYDISSARLQAYDVTIPQEDTPFFEQRGESSVLWQQDSRYLVVSNRHQNELYYVSVTGDVSGTSLGRMMPYRWSPDGQYLFAFGNDLSGKIGGFIIEPESGDYHALQSPTLLLSSSTYVVWSPNSEYLVAITRLGGVNSYTIAAFYRSGELYSKPLDIEVFQDSFISDYATSWLEQK